MRSCEVKSVETLLETKSLATHPVNHPESNKEQRKWSCFHLHPDGKKCIQKCELMKKYGLVNVSVSNCIIFVKRDF